MRVIVVTHDASGQVLKVCDDAIAFEDWLATSEWQRYDVDTWDCDVYDV